MVQALPQFKSRERRCANLCQPERADDVAGPDDRRADVFRLGGDVLASQMGTQHWHKTVQNGARERSPVDTGRLRSSITYQVGGREAKIGTNVFYAPFQEFGTSRGRWGTDSSEADRALERRGWLALREFYDVRMRALAGPGESGCPLGPCGHDRDGVV